MQARRRGSRRVLSQPKMRLIWGLFFRYRLLQRRGACNGVPLHKLLEAKGKRYLRAAAYIFNMHTLLMLSVSVLSVYICLQADIRWNMDFSLVATGTVFPLTYTISQAYGEPAAQCMPRACRMRMPCITSTCSRGKLPGLGLMLAHPSCTARREKACSLVANLKASVAALYYMHRDWVR